jgi:tetratricopeptide (TPR) repeat protein
VAPRVPRTTSPGIALDNLDVQIRGVEAAMARAPDRDDFGASLVELLLARGQYRGRIADYDRAASVADALVQRHPESGEAQLARASTLAAFHRFADALDALNAAERAGAPAPRLSRARATTYMAQGRFDDAAAVDAWPDDAGLDAVQLAAAATLAGERGLDAESERLFDRAGTAYRDVSPFPVAWVNFQHGSLLERKGNAERARLYFEVAREVLPTFAHACVHLAALDPPKAALVLLEPLLSSSDDPQVATAYAEALVRLDRSGEAEPLVARARKRYDELVARHPEAFADHAASFYLGVGHDPGRALALAKANATNRQTEAALDLLLLAASAAGDHSVECEAAARGGSLKYATAAFRATVSTAVRGCAEGTRPGLF